VETDPEAGLLLPANVPPLPVQVVALLHDQVSVLLPPLATVGGDALIETVGGLTTVTVVDCAAVPLVPVQLNVKVVLEVSGPVETDPETGLLVPANVPPLPVQVVALVDDQESVLLPPLAILEGDALIETVGPDGPEATDTIVD
jgi:hypothetical protein